jgi:hypothetical protein
MIASPSKTLDIRARYYMLEAMEICLRTGHTEIAKSLGEGSVSLKKRLETFDYSKEDKYGWG